MTALNAIKPVCEFPENGSGIIDCVEAAICVETTWFEGSVHVRRYQG